MCATLAISILCVKFSVESPCQTMDFPTMSSSMKCIQCHVLSILSIPPNVIVFEIYPVSCSKYSTYRQHLRNLFSVMFYVFYLISSSEKSTQCHVLSILPIVITQEIHPVSCCTYSTYSHRLRNVTKVMFK